MVNNLHSGVRSDGQSVHSEFMIFVHFCQPDDIHSHFRASLVEFFIVGTSFLVAQAITHQVQFRLVDCRTETFGVSIGFKATNDSTRHYFSPENGFFALTVLEGNFFVNQFHPFHSKNDSHFPKRCLAHFRIFSTTVSIFELQSEIRISF